jgi:hypothetical protein
MPIDKYFKGHGAEVMASMLKKYGAKKGKSVFYATSNKHPEDKPSGYAKLRKG